MLPSWRSPGRLACAFVLCFTACGILGCLGPGAAGTAGAHSSEVFQATDHGSTLVPAGRQAEVIKALQARIERLERQEARRLESATMRSSREPIQPSVPPLEPAIDPITGTLSAQRAVAGPTGDLSSQPVNDSDKALTAQWKNGLLLTTQDEAFRVHVGGRVQFDAGWNVASDAVQFGPGGIGDLDDGVVFRRASLRVDGTMYRNIQWLVEYDFANNVDNDRSEGTQPISSTSFSDVWATLTEIPVVGNLRVGIMGEPIGFTAQTSARWLNFMERAPGVNSFFLTSPGAMLFNWTENERATWAFGLFHDTDNPFGFAVGNGELAVTGRATWLPWDEAEGRELIHVGLGASHRKLHDGTVELRGRPSVRTQPGPLLPALADTGVIAANTQDVVNAELAGVFGPWTVQSEYYALLLQDAVFPNVSAPTGIPRGSPFYHGAYVEILYFLTGEYRAYDRKGGTFDRVVPLRNFDVRNGFLLSGAWQLGLRYAFLDLQSKGINGATLNDFVIGLNWFLNPNTKVQWNFALDHRSSTPPGSDGFTYIFGTRLAFDF